ncbi:MAG: DUF6573 family protein [Bacilli bacterium]
MENIISQYTRAQTIEDGVLIDVSKMAKEAGFTIPVAVWNEYIGRNNCRMMFAIPAANLDYSVHSARRA